MFPLADFQNHEEFSVWEEKKKDNSRGDQLPICNWGISAQRYQVDI